MADLLIQSLSQKAPALLAVEINEGWATVRLPDADRANQASQASPQIALKPYDGSTDLLYEIPSPEGMTRALLEAELDLHIPPMLSRQTEAHWVAAFASGYVLIQPVRTHSNLTSPLLALMQLMQAAQEFDGILLIEQSGMLLAQWHEKRVRLTAIPYDSSALVGADRAKMREFDNLSRSTRIILIGSEVTPEMIDELNVHEPHRYAAPTLQQLLACVTLDATTAIAIQGFEAAYALLIGVASSLAAVDGSFTVVR